MSRSLLDERDWADFMNEMDNLMLKYLQGTIDQKEWEDQVVELTKAFTIYVEEYRR